MKGRFPHGKQTARIPVLLASALVGCYTMSGRSGDFGHGTGHLDERSLGRGGTAAAREGQAVVLHLESPEAMNAHRGDTGATGTDVIPFVFERRSRRTLRIGNWARPSSRVELIDAGGAVLLAVSGASPSAGAEVPPGRYRLRVSQGEGRRGVGTLFVRPDTMVVSKDCPGCRLSGADLRRARLAAANLTRADLRTADLSRADLSGARLSGADLQGAVANRVRMPGANLRRADLSSADVIAGDLSGADLGRAVARDASFDSTNLKETGLSGADLTRATLRGAVLSGAELQGASFVRAELDGAVLKSAHLREVDFDGARLVGADLEDSVIDEASFFGADLRRANLKGARLRRVKFQGCSLIGATWTDGTVCGYGSLGRCIPMAPGLLPGLIRSVVPPDSGAVEAPGR